MAVAILLGYAIGTIAFDHPHLAVFAIPALPLLVWVGSKVRR